MEKNLWDVFSTAICYTVMTLSSVNGLVFLDYEKEEIPQLDLW